MGFIQGFQPHRQELRDFPFPLTPRPPLFSGLSTSGRLPSWMGSPSVIPGALLIFPPGPWALPGGPLLVPTGPEGLPPILPGRSSARGGSPWEERPAREGSLVGKQSWEVSQCELSADGFVISHKTGAFRFVNQSRLSHRTNVHFIGSKKALGSLRSLFI